MRELQTENLRVMCLQNVALLHCVEVMDPATEDLHFEEDDPQHYSPTSTCTIEPDLQTLPIT